MTAPPKAPLAPGYCAEPLWWANSEVSGRTAGRRPLERRADVVVVGSGYCGLAAAAELAARDRSVVVLEAEQLGAGASTRNGGMVIPELKHGPRALTKKYGALGRSMIDATFEAFELVEQLIAKTPIACDYDRSGGLLLAHHPAVVPALRDAEREWVDDVGEPVRFVSRDELTTEIGSNAYHGGLLMERTGGLHPAKFHAGLLARARDAGAEVHEYTRATQLVRTGGGFRVHTARGAIDCDDVFVATNAYADGLLPPLRRRVLPLGSFIVATEPLDAGTAESVSPRGRMFYDTKNLLFYWRLAPDRRLLFGGRTSLRRTTVARARDVLYDAMVRVHPQVAGSRIEFAWGGDVAITIDRSPHFGRLDGAAYATGCNGTGIALATWFGTRAAAWMSGEADPPPFASLEFPVVPFHRIRRVYLPFVGAWLRWHDRHGR